VLFCCLLLLTETKTYSLFKNSLSPYLIVLGSTQRRDGRILTLGAGARRTLRHLRFKHSSLIIFIFFLRYRHDTTPRWPHTNIGCRCSKDGATHARLAARREGSGGGGSDGGARKRIAKRSDSKLCNCRHVTRLFLVFVCWFVVVEVRSATLDM
jgi:hypothetical protein